jgi:hypothetical protein
MHTTAHVLRNTLGGLALAVGLAVLLPDAVSASGGCCTQCSCIQLCCSSDGCGPGGGGQSCDSQGCSWWCYNPINGDHYECDRYCV